MQARSGLFGGALMAAGLVAAPADAGGDRVSISESIAGFLAYDSYGGVVTDYAITMGPAGAFSYSGNGAFFFGEVSAERLAAQNSRDAMNAFWGFSYTMAYALFSANETFDATLSWDFAGWDEGEVLLVDTTMAQAIVEENESTLTSGTVQVTFIQGREYAFRGLVAGDAGGGSGFVLLPIVAGASFTQQPQSQVVEAGGAATLSVSVLGRGEHDAQWRRDGLPLADGDGVSGATTLELTIDPASYADTGTYDCVVNGDASQPAVLGVKPCLAGDTTGNGVVDFSDLNAVLAQFGAACDD